MNWKDPETWEEAAKQVADLIAKNEFLEKRKNFYKEQLTERSAQLIEAIRMLQEEGINFDEAMMNDWERTKRNRFNAELEQEVKAKAHASGDLAELLNDELNQKENDDER